MSVQTIEYMTCEQTREYDQNAIKKWHVPSIVLMENAGRSAAQAVATLAHHSQEKKVLIVCGGGNNGGDGFVIARHLHQFTSLQVEVVLTTAADKLKGDALINYKILTYLGMNIDQVDAEQLSLLLQEKSLVVDAVLGTGFSGKLRSNIEQLIKVINEKASRVFAVDIPSGMDANLGKVGDCCIKAQQTITFVAKKRGFATPNAMIYTGKLLVAHIGV